MTSRLKFSTIVVATDLSHQASSALRYAQALAHQHRSTLVLVHVIDPVGYVFPDGMPQEMAADEQARRECERIEAELSAQNLPVRSVVERGTVCERIVQALEDHHADLLVLGTRARSGVGRAALGTIARQLLAKSPCPILAVSPEAEEFLPWAGRWRRILAATDFSPASLEALAFAHRIADTHLLALHVSSCQGAEYSERLERLRYLAPFNESHTVPVEHVVTPGDPAETIAGFARRLHADLILLGAPEDELSEEDLSASTVLHVISRVDCPVLCVRAGKFGFASKIVAEVAVPC